MALDFSKLIYTNTATPYMDAYNKLKESTNANYNARVEQEKKKRNEYIAGQKAARQEWRTEQSGLRDAYRTQAENENTANIKTTNTGYDNTAQQNYINYMQAQKRLPSELNALGIRGGASESSLLRLGTNYGTNVANNEAAREAALDALRRQYEQNLNDYETEYRNTLASYDDTYNNRLAAYEDSYNSLLAQLAADRQSTLDNAYATAHQNQITWEREQLDKDLQNFSGAIEGLYGDTASYDSLIAQLEKSNDPNKEYKIMLARKAKQTLADKLAEQALAKASASRSYSSGGGRSYGGGGSYSSGGNDTSAQLTESALRARETAARAQAIRNAYSPTYGQTHTNVFTRIPSRASSSSNIKKGTANRGYLIHGVPSREWQ